jgi:hypothetical protein
MRDTAERCHENSLGAVSRETGLGVGKAVHRQQRLAFSLEQARAVVHLHLLGLLEGHQRLAVAALGGQQPALEPGKGGPVGAGLLAELARAPLRLIGEVLGLLVLPLLLKVMGRAPPEAGSGSERPWMPCLCARLPVAMLVQSIGESTG